MSRDTTRAAATHVTNDLRFAQIPEELLYDPAISAEAVRVYGVLARHGSDPANCFPGHQRIADFIGKSARSVPAWTKTLEDAGWITRLPRWRRGAEITDTEPDELKGWEPTSNAYIVHAVKRAAQRGVCAGERVPPRAGERRGSTPPRAPKESNVNESNSERENPLATDTSKSVVIASPRDNPLAHDLAVVRTHPTRNPPDFDAFVAVYPRQESIGVARSAWTQATKLAPAEDIIAGAQRYRDDPNRDPAFTLKPLKWLEAEGWLDVPEPPRPNISKSTRNLAAWAERTSHEPPRDSLVPRMDSGALPGGAAG